MLIGEECWILMVLTAPKKTVYAVNLLILANIYFHPPTWEKRTSMHPPWRHWHLLDDVLVRRRDQRDVMVTMTIPGADGWIDHCLVTFKMLPRRLFYGDVTTGSRQQGGQFRGYKDTLETSLRRLQINPTNWQDLVQDRPAWGRTVKKAAAIYEADRVTAAKAKRKARKSHQLRTPPHNASAQTPSTCPRCQRTFRAPIEFFDISRLTAPTIFSPSASQSWYHTPSANVERPPGLPLPSPSSSSSSSSTSGAVASAMPTNTTHNPDTLININTTTLNTGNENLLHACPRCVRTFTPHLGQAGHLRIHRAETGEPALGEPTHTYHIRLHCPHCTRTFGHCMGLLGHMRVHENMW
nr:unnamed protein product [Spirometra erinaceieuropaei]